MISSTIPLSMTSYKNLDQVSSLSSSISSTASDSALESLSLNFRSVLPNDQADIIRLHEEFFPVRYSKSFYDDMINGIGIFGGRLCSIIVEKSSNENNLEKKEIIGFVFGQMLQYPSQCEDPDLFQSNESVKEVFYILTIGCSQPYRKIGLASHLIERCISYASQFPTCGGVSIR
jgi:ribosomal protein S18 acetylase RimI-like enzyme